MPPLPLRGRPTLTGDHQRYVSDQEIRPIHRPPVRPTVCRHVLHQPLRADDAVSVALCRYAYRQGSLRRCTGGVFLVHGPDHGAAGPPPGHPAQFAHHLRQPGREQRADSYQGGRHLPAPVDARTDRRERLHRLRLVLFPEQRRPQRPAEARPAHAVDEAEKSGAGDTRGHLLRRYPPDQHLRGKERPADGQTLQHHDLPHDRVVRGPGHHPGRLRHAPIYCREEAPRDEPLQRRVV